MGASVSSILEESQPEIITMPKPPSDQEKARRTRSHNIDSIDLNENDVQIQFTKLRSLDPEERDPTFLYYGRQDDDGYFISSKSITYSLKEQIDDIAGASIDSMDQFLEFKADQFWNQHKDSIEEQREYNEQLMFMRQIEEEQQRQMHAQRVHQLQEYLKQIQKGMQQLQMEYNTYSKYFQQQCLQNMQGMEGSNVQTQYQQQMAVLNQNYTIQMNQLNVNLAHIHKEI
eukprot:320627_1